MHTSPNGQPIGWWSCELTHCPPNYTMSLNAGVGCLQRCNLVANSCVPSPPFAPDAKGTYVCANGTQVQAHLPKNSTCYPYFYVQYPGVPDPAHLYTIQSLIGL
jgi:hypothetical protein